MADMSFALDGIVESFSSRRSVSSAVSSAEPRRGVEFRVATRNSSARGSASFVEEGPPNARRARSSAGAYTPSAVAATGGWYWMKPTWWPPGDANEVVAGPEASGGSARASPSMRRGALTLSSPESPVPPGPTQEPCAVRGERDATSLAKRHDAISNARATAAAASLCARAPMTAPARVTRFFL